MWPDDPDWRHLWNVRKVRGDYTLGVDIAEGPGAVVAVLDTGASPPAVCLRCVPTAASMLGDHVHPCCRCSAGRAHCNRSSAQPVHTRPKPTPSACLLCAEPAPVPRPAQAVC